MYMYTIDTHMYMYIVHVYVIVHALQCICKTQSNALRTHYLVTSQ